MFFIQLTFVIFTLNMLNPYKKITLLTEKNTALSEELFNAKLRIRAKTQVNYQQAGRIRELKRIIKGLEEINNKLIAKQLKTQNNESI